MLPSPSWFVWRGTLQPMLLVHDYGNGVEHNEVTCRTESRLLAQRCLCMCVLVHILHQCARTGCRSASSNAVREICRDGAVIDVREGGN